MEKIFLKNLRDLPIHEVEKFREMCLKLGLYWSNYILNWFQLLHHPEFLRTLFENHVRLQRKNGVGVPYWYFVNEYMANFDPGESVINFVYKEWKNPSFIKPYSVF